MENFDELALTWDNEPGRAERARAIAAAIIKAVPELEGMNGLEYGCGTGLLSFILQPYLRHITLGDNSQGMLDVLKQKVAKAKITNMTPVIMDLATGNPSDQKFDIIYTMMALHHIADTDKVIDSFAKMLNPQGYLCIADLDEEDGSFHGEDFSGHHGFSRTQLAEKLQKYGFENISGTTCYQNIKKFPDGTERTYPMFLMVGRKKA